MKSIVFALIAISILLGGCEKDNPVKDTECKIIVGHIYHDYTDIVVNPCDVEVNIKDETYSFNKLVSIYSSHKPTTNQNIFLISLSDTTINKTIEFQIFTPFMDPEDFFTKSTIHFDTVKIRWANVVEDFFDANATFTWDTVSFINSRFSGKASLDIPQEIRGKINPDTYYPKQKIEFEFE